jgi:uncharacterized protein (DUF1778 family)
MVERTTYIEDSAMDRQRFTLCVKQWRAFTAALEAPARPLPTLSGF